MESKLALSAGFFCVRLSEREGQRLAGVVKRTAAPRKAGCAQRISEDQEAGTGLAPVTRRSGRGQPRAKVRDPVEAQEAKREEAQIASGSCGGAGEILPQVQNVLLELMRISDSDSVRVAAAKALIEKVCPKMEGGEKDGGEMSRNEERDRVLSEIRNLLDELAHSKSCGYAGAVVVDQESASGPADAKGGLAHMVDTGGARVG